MISRFLNYAAIRKFIVWISASESDVSSSPSVSAGSGVPSASENDGSIYMRTSGAVYVRDTTWKEIAKSEDITSAISSYTTTADLASVANGKGASLVGVEDAGALYTATDVEAALAEVMAAKNTLETKTIIADVTDPGDGVAIPVTRNASIDMIVAAATAETNTLADPSYGGQELFLIAGVVGGGGTRAITAAHGIDASGNTVMTFDAAGDYIFLKGVYVGGSLVWRIIVNNSVGLS